MKEKQEYLATDNLYFVQEEIFIVRVDGGGINQNFWRINYTHQINVWQRCCQVKIQQTVQREVRKNGLRSGVYK